MAFGGAAVVAAPASAATFGGHITHCAYQGTKVSAIGNKAAHHRIDVKAAGVHKWADGTQTGQLWARGASGTGHWTVYGSWVTGARGYCS